MILVEADREWVLSFLPGDEEMGANRERYEDDTESMVSFAEPPMFKVILLNDDYTPMDFVVMILKNVFHKSQGDAESIMLSVHNNGSAVCGIYTYEIAETKVAQVSKLAGDAGYPLRCTMEED